MGGLSLLQELGHYPERREWTLGTRIAVRASPSLFPGRDRFSTNGSDSKCLIETWI